MTTPTTDPGLWAGVGTIIAALLSGAGGWLMGRRKNAAAESAEIAAYGANQAEAEADGLIYRRLIERVTALEGDIRRLNTDVEAERRIRRRVEDHVFVLERLMRAAGMDPPQFDPFSPPPFGEPR